MKFEDVMEPGKSFLWRKSGLQTAESWPEKKGLEPGERKGAVTLVPNGYQKQKGMCGVHALALSTSCLLFQYKRKKLILSIKGSTTHLKAEK